LVVNDHGVSTKSIDAFVCEWKGFGGVSSENVAEAMPQEGK
jgi:hypothetical protein